MKIKSFLAIAISLVMVLGASAALTAQTTSTPSHTQTEQVLHVAQSIGSNLAS